MKKILAIAVALILLSASLVFVFSALGADGDPEKPTICNACGQKHEYSEKNGKCHCCPECAYLDSTYLLDCAKDTNGHFKGSYCCDKCTGIWPCHCDCGCEFSGERSEEATTTPTAIVPEPAQRNILSIFRNVMSKITEVFDKLFDALFIVFQIKK